MSERYQRAFAVPEDFPALLKTFTREILRAQPENLYEFGARYFAELVEVRLAPRAYAPVCRPPAPLRAPLRCPWALAQGVRRHVDGRTCRARREGWRMRGPRRLLQARLGCCLPACLPLR